MDASRMPCSHNQEEFHNSLKGNLMATTPPSVSNERVIDALAEDGALAIHVVVRNQEDRHSIWPTDRDLPVGWERTGFVGDRNACLAEISRVWVDIRPLSVRN
jgi:MbtH protein